MLEGSFRTLWVKGEISNLATPASGHMYFSLKDATSQVRCAFFKGRNRLLKFKPENGDEVLIQANVSLYEGRGEFQLIVQDMEPAGLGALQKAFEQLKAKLAAEGLFSDIHKKPLPEYPKTIGVITSPTGAAIRDILTTLKRRYPLADVIIYPVPVQGTSAANEIASMINKANGRKECDVLILARGGGSLEDLWSFNEEVVARAMFDASIPIVTGVGHEIDFTIADFVADLRAPTPTSAAEHVSPDKVQTTSNIILCKKQIGKCVASCLKQCASHLEFSASRLINPNKQLSQWHKLSDELYIRQTRVIKYNLKKLSDRLTRFHYKTRENILNQKFSALRTRNEYLYIRLNQIQKFELNSRRKIFSSIIELLNTLSPLNTLNRGYSLTYTHNKNELIRKSSGAKKDDRIKTVLGDGYIISKVEISKSK